MQKTLTCLELEIASSQPTIPSGSTHPGSDSDEDVRNNATMLNPSEFIGAAVSMLPPGEGSEAIFEGIPLVGSTVLRDTHEESLQEAETTSDHTSVEAATFSTLFPFGLGGEKNTPTGCTHRHYIRKTLGSVARHFARAHEVIAYCDCSPICQVNCNTHVHFAVRMVSLPRQRPPIHLRKQLKTQKKPIEDETTTKEWIVNHEPTNADHESQRNASN